MPNRDNTPAPAKDAPKTPDRGVEAADKAIDAEGKSSVASKQDLDRAVTAGREGKSR